MSRSASDFGFLGQLIAGCVMLAGVYLAHEFGHFLTARLVGLRADLVVLGGGPKLFEVAILGSLVRVHAFLDNGATYITSDSRHWLRLRLWLSVFAGPASNICLAIIVELYWRPLTHVFGGIAVLLFLLLNILVAARNLFSFRKSKGPPCDGKRLLTLPFKSQKDLDIYLRAADYLRAMLLFEKGAFESARESCLRGLARFPDDLRLAITLSACEINLENYGVAIGVLERFKLQATLQPGERATLNNNLAYALLLDEPATLDAARLERIGSLSQEAFADFPCVLPYRSTRALILAASNRAEEALALLSYPNYARGSAIEQSNCEAARALALERLGRCDEAGRAAEAAVRLCEQTRATLRRLQVLPVRELHDGAG